MIAGCYTLDLYCDNPMWGPDGTFDRNPNHRDVEFPEQFTGYDRGEAYRAARRRG